MNKLLAIIITISIQHTLVFCQTGQNNLSDLKGSYLGQKPPGEKAEPFAPKINEVIDEAVKLGQFSGTVMVGKGGAVIFSRSVGYADKEKKIRNTSETMYNIGSIGKSFTATTIMILVEDSLLDINEPVKNYLPDIGIDSSITTFHLLTHTSGLGNYFSKEEVAKENDISKIMKTIESENLLFNPGTDMSYSNSGYIILGALIEKISGMKYSEFLANRIFYPLKMNNSSVEGGYKKSGRKAIGYTRTIARTFIDNKGIVAPPGPAGGIYCSATDLLKFDRSFYDELLLSEKTQELMFTPFMKNYACGWGVFERFDNRIIGHGGSTVGVSCWFRRYTNDRYSIIVLSNYNNGADAVFSQIESILFKQPYELPVISAGEFLYNTIKKIGIGPVLKSPRGILEEKNYHISNPHLLDDFAYTLLDQGDIDLAMAFFTINIILFHEVEGVWDSMEAVSSDEDFGARAKVILKEYLKSINDHRTIARRIELFLDMK